MAPLRPFPAPSIPPMPTLPILIPPLTILAIILILYIRRPPTIVPTRPMATIKTPLLAHTTRAGTRMRGHQRIPSYGGVRATTSQEPCPCGEPECGKETQRGRREDRPRLVRRVEDDHIVDSSGVVTPAAQTTAVLVQGDEDIDQNTSLPTTTTTTSRTNSLPTLTTSDHDDPEGCSSGDDHGPSTPEDVEAPIRLQRRGTSAKGKMKSVDVVETEVVETPAEERDTRVDGIDTRVGVQVTCA